MRPGGAPENNAPCPPRISRCTYHIIFSTKDRAPIIAATWRERLHAYLGGVVRNLDGVPEAIGGVADHVHLLIGLRATHCLADVVRDTKAFSSRWTHDEMRITPLAWQEGYGAFTVSPSQRDLVREYIAAQEEHHRQRTFQDEYVEFLQRSGIEFDERFLW